MRKQVVVITAGHRGGLGTDIHVTRVTNSAPPSGGEPEEKNSPRRHGGTEPREKIGGARSGRGPSHSRCGPSRGPSISVPPCLRGESDPKLQGTTSARSGAGGEALDCSAPRYTVQ